MRTKQLKDLMANVNTICFSETNGEDGIKLECGHWGNVECMLPDSKCVCSSCFLKYLNKIIKESYELGFHQRLEV